MAIRRREAPLSPSPVLLLAFTAFGVLWGAWQALLPDLTRRLEISEGLLGLLLAGAFAATLPVMLAGGRLVDRLGTAPTLATAALLMALSLVLTSVLPPIPAFAACLVVFLAASGAYDVAINAAAMGHARWSSASRLTLLHAGFSGGGAVGALAAGALAGGRPGFSLAYVMLAAGLGAVALAALLTRWPITRAAGDAMPPRLLRTLAPIALLASMAFLAEGSMETWSAIYLRVELGAPAFIGALGPAAFHAAMLVGRLLGAGVSGALGPSRTLAAGGSLTALAMLAALAVPLPAVAIPGLAAAALGVSFAFPVAASLAAARAAGSGRGASYVLTLGYGGFLVGPPHVGLLAEALGLRTALLVIPLAGLVIAAVGWRVARDAHRS